MLKEKDPRTGHRERARDKVEEDLGVLPGKEIMRASGKDRDLVREL